MDYVPYVHSNDNYGSDTNDETLEESEIDIFIVYTMMMVVGNTHNMFDLNELEEGGRRTVNHNVGVTDVLDLMHNVLAFEF